MVFVNPEQRLNDLTVTTVWGGPSLQNYHRIPALPVAEIKRSDGDSLRAMLTAGPVQLRMSTETKTGRSSDKIRKMQEFLRWLANLKGIPVESGAELKFELTGFPSGGLGLLTLLGLLVALIIVISVYRRERPS